MNDIHPPIATSNDTTLSEAPSTTQKEYNEDLEKPLKYIFERLIPHETQHLIFNRLDLNCKKVVRLVCHWWKTLVDDTLNFNIILNDWNANYVVQFGLSGNPVNYLTVSKLEDFQYPENGMGFSKVFGIKLLPHVYPSPSLPDESSTEEIHIGITERNLLELLDEFRDIKSFAIDSGAVSASTNPSFMANVPLNDLVDLEISINTVDRNGMHVCRNVMKNTYPKLESIDFKFLDEYEDLLSTDIFSFISRHGKTLNDLKLCFERDQRQYELQQYEIEDPLEMGEAHFQNLLKKLQTVNKLTSFVYHLSVYESMSTFQFGSQLLRAQSSLVKLEIENTNIGIWGILPEVFNHCAGTITEVVIYGCLCSVNAEAEEFNCTRIKRCLRLKIFQLHVYDIKITNIEDLPKQIETLSLGEMLTMEQIEFIISNLALLDVFYLPQGQAPYNGSVPKLTLDLFTLIIKRVSILTQLVFAQRSSSFKRIQKFISYTQGLTLMDHVGTDQLYTGLLVVQINRKVLDVDRL